MPRTTPRTERDRLSWAKAAGSMPALDATCASKVREKNPRSSPCGVGWNSRAPSTRSTAETFTGPREVHLGRSSSDLRHYAGHAGRHSTYGPSSQLRQTARRGVIRVWIRHEYPGNFAVVGDGTYGYPGQLVGGGRTCRDSQQRRGGAHGSGHLRVPAIDDRDDHGQGGVPLHVHVLVGDN